MDNKIITPGSGEKECFLGCRNSQGMEIRATPLRLTRYVVVFEVYNPYSILQLSEVLSDFRIIMNERLVYSGRAVVSNLVNTGILLICEATLDESWLEVDVFSPINQWEKLRLEFAQFLREWEKINRIIPDFKVTVADMQALLTDLRRWLEQVELGIRSEPSGNRAQIERDVIHELYEPILPLILSWFNRFDQVTEQVEEEARPAHGIYVRRLLHPLVLCAPFVYRSFNKPLGYAGDYEMVNMILRDPREGSSLFAKIVNVCFLKNPPSEAHRNRIRILEDKLRQETLRVAKLGRHAKFYNLGCGPAKELRDFMVQDELSNQAEFTLVDFNEETILHSSQQIEEIRTRHHRETGIEFQKRSVHQLLKDASKPVSDLQSGQYDMVYCAGLFDYMSDRICKRLMNVFYDMLAPGGLLLATNVDASKPFRHSMELILEWHLICRSPAQMRALIPDRAPANSFSITSEPTGVNVFIEVRKTDRV